MIRIRSVVALMSAAALITAVTIPVRAGPPDQPSSFYGQVQFHDSAPAPGAELLAYVPGVAGAVATTTLFVHEGNLVYTIDVPADDTETPAKDGGVAGDVIRFEIGGRVVMTGIWQQGTNVARNIHPPKALPGGPYSGNEGAPISFSGSAQDYGNDATTYEWDWGRDGTIDATGPTPTASWPDNMTVLARLRVTDSQGGVGVADFEITINNVAPTLTITGAASVDEGATYTLTLSHSDPGADTLTSWNINWGDGQTSTVPGASVSATHVYTDGPANVMISASATDEDGTYNANALNVTVNNVAPTLTIAGAASVNEGATYTLTLSHSDPGADTLASWTIDWGDGQTQTALGASASVTHTYADGPANVTISASATDEDGTHSANSLNVTVNNVAPTLTIAGAASVNEGATYTLTLSRSDPGADTLTSWTINWGDGNMQTVSGASASATHFYTDDLGSVTISASATDEDGAYNANSLNVTVNDVPPTAVSAGGPYSAIAGQAVALHGTATCAPVDTCTYEWDLDNDGAYDDATGPDQSATWNTVGNYTIGLRVTDDDGSFAITSATVSVQPASRNVSLVAGWNLVSFNLIPVDTAVTSVLSSVAGKYNLVYAWNSSATSNNWLRADNDPMSPDTLHYLDHRMGFWIHMTEAATLVAQGSLPGATNIQLNTEGGGWNLVGYPALNTTTLPDALSAHGVGANFTLVYAFFASNVADPWKVFDRTAPAWSNDLTAMSPYWGYWVKTSVDDLTWHVEYP